MKLFHNTRAIHNTAFMLLLVWLFALASGVANACLLEARQTHSHIATDASSGVAAQASVILPGHAGAVADGIDEPHFKAPCLKVCDDGSRSFPKQDSTVVQADPGPALLVLVLWNKVAPVISTLRHMNVVQPATPELPIRVRFSRLAI
ncbi:hypothetical protein [Polaromonas sp.]|uniref:hypothetical protein n=1 Tax=Polaromonas sp. TaxID=1869339 RepID=UPI0025D7B91F|nr:hypothetical protein [Polaromonas sp.]